MILYSDSRTCHLGFVIREAAAGSRQCIHRLELGELIPELTAAFLHDLCHEGTVRILCFQELLDRTQLLGDVAWVLLLDAVDEVLEIITIPAFAQALHDIDPIRRLLSSVPVQLIDAAFTVTQIMAADEVIGLVIDMDLSTDDLVTDRLECVRIRHRILAGLVQNIGESGYLIRLETVW